MGKENDGKREDIAQRIGHGSRLGRTQKKQKNGKIRPEEKEYTFCYKKGDSKTAQNGKKNGRILDPKNRKMADMMLPKEHTEEENNRNLREEKKTLESFFPRMRKFSPLHDARAKNHRKKLK